MEQVELSEFIRNALVQIANGVKKANEDLKDESHDQEVYALRDNKGDNAKIPGVKFDVAVTAATSQKDKAGFFVALMQFGGGATTEKVGEGERVHRIQFEVGVAHYWS